MIVAIEPVAAPRLGFTCDVTPNGDEEHEHASHVKAFVVVHLKLPMGVIEVPMCTGCLGELVEALQGGDRVIKIEGFVGTGEDW